LKGVTKIPTSSPSGRDAPSWSARFSLPHSAKSLTIFAAFTRATALGARAPMFKDAILWLWTAKSVKIWRITHRELAMTFDDEFAINTEEEA